MKDHPECLLLSMPYRLSVATLVQRPLGPTPIANLFWLIPLSILIYQLEATNLEELMRLSVRLGPRISHSSGFSRDIQGTPKHPKYINIYQCSLPISNQPNYRDSELIKNKKEHALGAQKPSPPSLMFPLNIHILGWEY